MALFAPQHQAQFGLNPALGVLTFTLYMDSALSDVLTTQGVTACVLLATCTIGHVRHKTQKQMAECQ